MVNDVLVRAQTDRATVSSRSWLCLQHVSATSATLISLPKPLISLMTSVKFTKCQNASLVESMCPAGGGGRERCSAVHSVQRSSGQHLAALCAAQRSTRAREPAGRWQAGCLQAGLRLRGVAAHGARQAGCWARPLWRCSPCTRSTCGACQRTQTSRSTSRDSARQASFEQFDG